MSIVDIIYPVLAIGGMGLIFGTGLGVASKKFFVPTDERVEAIKNNLPGANCGGCGFAGCEAFAKSVVSGDSKVNGCPVCNENQVKAISAIMGLRAEIGERKIAAIRCGGSHINATIKYEYTGITNCQDAHLVNGGPKVCQYGCLGFGSCMKKCSFDAIEIINGLAVIHKEKCKGCGSCVASCPRNLIHIVGSQTSYHVNCISRDRGKEVKASCKIGCIGCGICVKQCEVGAISLSDNVARIDSQKCIACGKCMLKCPTKAINNLLEETLKKEKNILPKNLEINKNTLNI